MNEFNKARATRGEDKKSVRKLVSALKKESHRYERRNWRSVLRDVESYEDDVRPVRPGDKKFGAWDIT